MQKGQPDRSRDQYLAKTNSAEECALLVKEKEEKANAMIWSDADSKNCFALFEANGWEAMCDTNLCKFCLFEGIQFRILY